MAKVAQDRRAFLLHTCAAICSKFPRYVSNSLHSVAYFAKYRDGLSITPQATSQDIPLT